MGEGTIKISFSNGNRPIFTHIKEDSLGLDLDLDVVYEGNLSYEMDAPGLGDLTEIMRTSAMTAVQINLQRSDNVDPKDLDACRAGLAESIRQDMTAQWESRGVRICEVEITKLDLSEADKLKMDRLYRMAEMRDPKVAAKKIEEAQKSAMEMNLQIAKEAVALGPLKWKCPKCGSINTGRFCMECGKKREWICTCGTVNLRRYCTECGKGRALVEFEQKQN